jgi:polysaccharide biosynthesis transport protein
VTSIPIREQAPQVFAPTARRPGRAPAAVGGLTGKDLLRILRKRKWLILLCLTITTAVAVVATEVMRRYMPYYTAQAYVRLSPPAKTALVSGTQYYNVDAVDQFKKTNIPWVKSQPVLDAALKSEKMMRTAWYRAWTANDPEHKAAIQELQDQLRVNAMPDTELIGISLSVATGDSGEIRDLPAIVNAVAEAFIKRANEDPTSTRNAELTTLRNRDKDITARLEKLKGDIQATMRQMKVPAIRRQVDSLTVEEQDLTRRLTELGLQQDQAAAAREAILAQDKQGGLDTNPMVMQALEMDPVLRGLDAQLNGRESGREIIEIKYGPNHPQRKAFEASVGNLKSQRKAREDEMIKKNVEALKQQFDQQLGAITAQVVRVDQRLRGVQSERADLNRALVDVENLEAERDNDTLELNRIRARISDLQVVIEALPVYMYDAAQIPTEPSWPKRPLMYTLGVLLGLAIGVGLAFMLELMDTSVKTPTDVARRFDLSLLAMVPHAEDLPDEVEDFRRVCLDNPDSLVGESFRELRTNLLFSGPADQRRRLLITSPSPDDGRTTVTVNLAAAIANSGRSVLVVDANFRRPAIGKLFLDGDQVGLSDVLSGQKTWQECVHKTAVPNLSVMVSGKLPPNPNELLGSDVAKSMLAQMAEQYDQVIVDGPPFLLISDAGVLATEMDGVVLVIRAGVNTHGIVDRCRQGLARIGAHTLGVVLNGVRVTAGGYLQKNYDAFDEYRSDSESA